MPQIKCYTCLVEKPQEDFYRDANYADGFSRQCKSCSAKHSREYREKNRDSIKEQLQKWRVKNAAWIRKYNRKRNRKKRAAPENRVCHNLSSRIRYALKGGKKGKRTLQLTGCDVLFLRKYIESLWKQGMSWENYGMWKRGGKMTWHIDHIIPCDAFDLNKIGSQTS